MKICTASWSSNFKNAFNLLLLVGLFSLITLKTNAQSCTPPPVGCSNNDFSNSFLISSNPNTIEYDNIVSTFHSTVARQADGTIIVWGERMANNGTSHVLTPQLLNSINYPALTGTVLKFTGGSENGATTPGQQFVVLTTNGLFAWGVEGRLIDPAITTSTTFQKLTINSKADGLPTGVTPGDVKMLFGSHHVLGLVTCNGDAWTLVNAETFIDGNLGATHPATATASAYGDGTAYSAANNLIWHKVKQNASTNISNVVAVRGAGLYAFTALKSDGTLWTWGYKTYLGNGTAVATRTYATQMTLPAGATPKMIGMKGMSFYDNVSYHLLSTTGSVYGLGSNQEQQLGDRTATDRTSWVQVLKSATAGDYLANIKWISPSEHDAEYMAAVNALESDGSLWSWGSNEHAMLGQAYPPYNINPTKNNGGLGTSKLLAVETGGHTTIVIKQCDGQYGYVGHRINGSMGDGSAADVTDPNYDFSATATLDLCAAPSVAHITSPLNNSYVCESTPVTVTSNNVAGGTYSIASGNAIINSTTGVLALVSRGGGDVKIKYSTTTPCTSADSIIVKQRDFGNLNTATYPVASATSVTTNQAWLGTVFPTSDCATDINDDADGLAIKLGANPVSGAGTQVSPWVLNSGVSHTFNVTVNGSGASKPVYWAMWFDVNGNGSFTDAADIFQTGITNHGSPVTTSFSATSPIVAISTAGAIRLVSTAVNTTFTKANNGTVALTNGEVEDFYVLTTPIIINGNVFYDTNQLGDLIVNGTPTNAAGTLIAVLYDNTTGKVVDTAYVTASGTYTFDNGVISGNNYSVYLTSTPAIIGQTAIPTITLPSGYINTGENVGSGAGSDGTVNGILPIGVVSSNISNTNFGILKPLALGNLVWKDANNNGIKEASESFFPGVIVNLYVDANNDNIPDGPSVATDTTDLNGDYTFSDLVPNNYIVGIVLPVGYSISSVNGGDPDNNIDSDNNGINIVGGEVRSNAITLTLNGEPTKISPTGGNINFTLDFGVKCSNIGAAGADVTAGICDNDATVIDMLAWNGGQVGGVWTKVSGTGGTFNAAAGTFSILPLPTTTTVFRYVVAGTAPCVNDTAIVTINVNPVKRTTQNITICQGDSVVVFNPQTTAKLLQPQEKIAHYTAGTYIDTLVGATRFGCDSIVTTNLTVNPKANAGVDGGTTICTSDFTAITLANLITGEQAGGTWTRLTGTGGTFSAGVFTPAAGATTSTFRYIVTGAAPCANDTSIATVNITTCLNLGDKVWVDLNNNGIVDGGENGIAGVTVNLYADANGDNIPDGSIVATATTDGTGSYNFIGLIPNNYIVGIVLPSGYFPAATTATSSNPNNDNNVDNNGVNVVAGELRSNYITLSVGGEPASGVDGDGTSGNRTLDFGIRPNPISCATKELMTDTRFIFTNGGTQTVSPSSLNFNGWVGSGSGVIDISNNDTYIYDNFETQTFTHAFTGVNPLGSGAVITMSLGIRNGIAGIPVINNYGKASVLTIKYGGVVYATVTTDSLIATDGHIATVNYFNGATGSVPNGNTVDYGPSPQPFGVMNLANWQIFLPTSVPNNSNLVVEFDPGGSSSGNAADDFAVSAVSLKACPIIISGNVFNDTNGLTDNTVNGTPTNLSGTLIAVLYDNTTGRVVDTVYVTSSGTYTFDNGGVVLNNNYSVYLTTTPSTIGQTATPVITLPSGFVNTGENLGTGAGNDGSVNSILPLGVVSTNLSNANFGVSSTVSVGNTVWLDLNNNGVKDYAEFGVSGVTVKLYVDANNDNVPDGASIATITTGTTGNYNFAGLAPGNYIVGTVLPTGYTGVTTNGGDPDNNIDDDNNGVTTVSGEFRSNAVTLTVGGETITNGYNSSLYPTTVNNNQTLDFAIKGTSTIGDFVWKDIDSDGIQDAGEPGLPGVAVILTFPGGQTYATTTDATGAYQFNNLPISTYTVTFIAPPNYTASPANAGANDAIDSDPISGVVTGVTIATGATNLTVDAGFVPNAVITCPGGGGIVLDSLTTVNKIDMNAAGTQSSFISGSGILGGERDMQYTISSTPPYTGNSVYTGLNMWNMATSASAVINSSKLIWDGGDHNAATLDVTNGLGGMDMTGAGNFSYTFTNADFVPINGVVKFTVYSSPTAYSTHTYTITTTGPATVSFLPSDFVIGAGAATVANFASVTAVVMEYSTTSNGSDVVFTGPIKVPCPGGVSLGNNVWFDVDNDGIKDTNEPGVPSATVNIYLDANNDNIPDGAAIATTTTNASGNYSFTGLAPNNYIVGVVIPTGYVAQTINGGDPDNNTDNDNNGITIVGGEIRSNSITLSTNGEPTTDGDDANGNQTLDFALKGLLNVGNQIWYDQDIDGKKDPGEIGFAALEAGVGLSSVTVYLYQDINGDNVPDGPAINSMTVPASTGIYAFGNLIPGNYIIGVLVPSEYSGTRLLATSANPNNDTDNDNNGINTLDPIGLQREIRTGFVTLSANGEPASGIDGDGANGNLTVDIGFALAILPVDLLSFSGTLKENVATLNWKVTNEVNLDHYELERSINGLEFKKILEKVTTNQQGVKEYTVNDNVESLQATTIYYKLKMVDKDGSSKYSNIVTFQKGDIKESISLHPNPASSKFIVTVNTNKACNAIIRITTISGMTMVNKAVKLVKGTNTIDFSEIRSWANGVYNITVLTEDNALIEKLIINK